MGVAIGDGLSIGVGGWLTSSGTTVPAAPTGLAVTNDGDGDAVTLTVTGADGVSYQAYYRKVSGGSWTTGETRVDAGVIAQPGLDNNTWYEFQVVAMSGSVPSLPSLPVRCFVTDQVPPTATGPLSVVLEQFRAMVAGLSAFQAWTGTADATSAKQRVYLEGIHRELRTAFDTADYPYALIYHADAGGRHERIADLATLESGEVVIRLVDRVASSIQDLAEVATLTFENSSGAVLAGLMGLAPSDANVSINAVDWGPVLLGSEAGQTSDGQLVVQELTVDWGP